MIVTEGNFELFNYNRTMNVSNAKTFPWARYRERNSPGGHKGNTKLHDRLSKGQYLAIGNWFVDDYRENRWRR